MVVMSLPLRTLVFAASAGVLISGLAQDRDTPASAPPQSAPPQSAQPQSAQPQSAQPQTEPAAPPIDPDAIAALEKMGAHLRTLTAFEINGTTLTDEVMDDGSKLQFGSTVSLKVRRPDRLRLDSASDRKERQLMYDGKSITLYSPRLKYYATTAAPPTLNETIELLAKKYGIEMPLADLFYWGTDKSSANDITVARHIGPATVDGASTEHYAFRQEGVDWQIWIQKGAAPLPRKLVVTDTSIPEQPQTLTVMRWNTAPKLDQSLFAFKPPQGAMKIVLQNADGKVENVK